MTRRVVVVGGGCAEVAAVRVLASDQRFKVLLVAPDDVLAYRLGLYRPVIVPLHKIVGGAVTLHIDTVSDVMQTTPLRGTGTSTYTYDDVIAMVPQQHDFDKIRNAYHFTRVEELERLKDAIHAQMQDSSIVAIHCAVIGGGVHGVEIAAELAEYVPRVLLHHQTAKPVQIDLIESSPRVLPTVPERLARRLNKRLTKLGVTIYTSTTVKPDVEGRVKLPAGDSRTLIVWTPSTTDTSASPHTVLQEVQLGQHAAANLRRAAAKQSSKIYQPTRTPEIISVGRHWCGVYYRGIQLYGWFGWLIWRYADFQLYLQLMPLRAAVVLWLRGADYRESCEICRS